MRVSMMVAALGLLLAPTACDEATGPVSPDHIGVFHLQTLNGQELPVEFSATDLAVDKLELTSSSRTLNTDGTYRSELRWRQTVGDDVVEDRVIEEGDFYSLGESHIGFHPDGEGSYGGDITGDVLTIRQGQSTSVFVR